jgi:hypothetical protein
MAKVNEFLGSPGSFALRFDDNSRHVMAGKSKQYIQDVANGQLGDLQWLGVCPDSVIYQSDLEERVKMFLAGSRFQMVIDHAFDGCDDTKPKIKVSPAMIRPMRMSTWIIAERVVLDHYGSIDAVVRGVDLLQGHALYVYFCALFGFKFPEMIYLPRLMAADENISKTKGNWTVEELRNLGVFPTRVIELLRSSCLKDPTGSWHFDNVKDAPRLTVTSVEDLLW